VGVEMLLVLRIAHVALLESPLSAEERDLIDVWIDLLERDIRNNAVAEERRLRNLDGG
jgi:hypothetical protein